MTDARRHKRAGVAQARVTQARIARARIAPVLVCVATAVLGGCAGDVAQREPVRTAQQIEADIEARIPAGTPGRAAWASDLQLVLAALKIEPNRRHICAVLAVVEQESTYRADPPVPQLGKIAREEMMRRAEAAGVPDLAVNLALKLDSPDGRSWDQRLEAVRTEGELSTVFEQFIATVPLGRQLLAGYNPVRTGGPMQVSIAYAQAHAQAKPYPFPGASSVRHEVFTRRGGLYFGTAHLLDYAAPYGQGSSTTTTTTTTTSTDMIYRFADFNAGHYASRNAAFQQAAATASGMKLDLDGDLLLPGAGSDMRSAVGQTEAAVRSLAAPLGLDARQIRAELQRGEAEGFERRPIYLKVMQLAEQRSGQRPPRAVLPRIALQSPKITRKLTTEWFARRVDERYQRCLKVGSAG